MPSVLWAGADGGLQRCAVERTAEGGHRLAGTVLFALDGDPIEIRYSVVADSDWRTLVVGSRVEGEQRRDAVAVHGDGSGHWEAGGNVLEVIEGCIDVDLEFTPATTTVAISRLALGIGEEAEIEVAWIRFPERDVRRATRRFVRLDELRYSYAASGIEAALLMHPNGLVHTFGDRWHTVGVGR
jgi:hypothetical protein